MRLYTAGSRSHHRQLTLLEVGDQPVDDLGEYGLSFHGGQISEYLSFVEGQIGHHPCSPG